jgi:hypothetical protein
MDSTGSSAGSPEAAAAPQEVQAVVLSASDFILCALLFAVVVLVIPKHLKRLFSSKTPKLHSS